MPQWQLFLMWTILHYFSIISSINKSLFLKTKKYIWCHNLHNLVPLMNVLALPPARASTTVCNLLACSIALQSTCKFRFHERQFLFLSSRAAGSIVYVVMCSCVWCFVQNHLQDFVLEHPPSTLPKMGLDSLRVRIDFTVDVRDLKLHGASK